MGKNVMKMKTSLSKETGGGGGRASNFGKKKDGDRNPESNPESGRMKAIGTNVQEKAGKSKACDAEEKAEEAAKAD